MIFVLYTIAFVLLFISIRKKPNCETGFFNKKDTNILKGFSAIMVLFHHIGQRFQVENYDVINFNGNMGGIAVGVFFMLSAYGLFKSHLSNEKYYKKIFLVKIPILYIYQVLINTLYYLLFFKTSNLKTSETLLRIFNLDIFCGLDRMNGYSWFITTILIVYLLVGVILFIAHLLKNKISRPRMFLAIASTFIITLLFFVVKFTPISSLYHRSIFCFVIGTIICLFEKEIVDFLKNKKYYILLTIFTIIWASISFAFFSERDVSLSICVLLALLASKITFGENKLYYFFGVISLEIYLLQLIFFNYININLELICALSITGSTIITSYLLNLIFTTTKKIINLIFKKIKKETNNT